MSSNRKPEVSEPKAPEPLPVDPEERLDWDYDIGERPPTRTWRVRVEPTNGASGSEEEIANDELLIQEPESLVRGQTHVTVVGGGRDRPIVVLEDDEVCSE